MCITVEAPLSFTAFYSCVLSVLLAFFSLAVMSLELFLRTYFIAPFNSSFYLLQLLKSCAAVVYSTRRPVLSFNYFGYHEV